MKRFVIKFYVLFAIILGMVGYYAFHVHPNISGDLGRIGQIPFGREYKAKLEQFCCDKVLRISTIEKCGDVVDTVITIGDSFSQCGKCGYSQFMADVLECHVTNIAMENDSRPEQLFIQLVANGKIPKHAIVIVESVERAMLRRLCNINLNDTALIISDRNNQSISHSNQSAILSEMMVWLRTSVGLKNAVRKFNSKEDLFSHKTIHNRLYVYDSEWDSEGDLRFVRNGMIRQNMAMAYLNLIQLHKFAEANGIRLFYLVAADKYDVYDPFIIEKHKKNPTLDAIPEEGWIVNSKAILQEKAHEGVKDLYYINDTHWSPVGAQIIGEEIARRVRMVQ